MSIPSISNDDNRNARPPKAFWKKAEACEESSGYWQETLVFLKERVFYFKNLTQRNGTMRATLPPDYKAVIQFVEEFNDFISILDCLNDCISIKSLIEEEHWKALSLGIAKAKICWPSKIEGRLSEYLQRQEQGRSAREQFRFDAMDAIFSFTNSLEKTFRTLDEFSIE